MKTPRQRRSAFALGILTAIVGTLPALATPFYTYSIAARTGVDLDGSGFVASSISPRVSLNDSGTVAFIATTADGRSGVFVAEPAGGGFTIRKLAETANGNPDSRSRRREEAHFDSEFGSRAATAKLAAKERKERKNVEGGLFLCDRCVLSWPFRGFEIPSRSSEFDQNLVTSAATRRMLVKATTARRITTIDPCQPWASCPFTTRDRYEAYDDLLDSVSMNDSGRVALIGQIFLDDGQRFYNLTRQSQYQQTSDPFGLVRRREGRATRVPELCRNVRASWNPALRGFLPDFKPVIANSGEIVARVGNQADSPILLYPPGLGAPQAIADSASFTKIGRCPGLSDDEQVVAFYGELKSDKTKQTTLRHCNVVSLPTIPTPPVRTA
jgi:hypothetical protein